MRISQIIESNNLTETPQVGDIVTFEFGEDVAVEGMLVLEDNELVVQLDETGQDYLTELLPLIPLAITGAGAAWTAYDAYQAKKAYDRGDISKADLVKQIGTDAALTVLGGGIAKAASTVGKAAIGGARKLTGRSKAVDNVTTTPTKSAPSNTPTAAKRRRPPVASITAPAASKDSTGFLAKYGPNAQRNEAAELAAIKAAKKKKTNEAEYQGRKVSLSKPIRTGRDEPKKFKVYVKDGDKVKMVRFGHQGEGNEKTMSIKKSDPKRRKSFRARHNCDNPGPKTSARYWSCKAW